MSTASASSQQPVQEASSTPKSAQIDLSNFIFPEPLSIPTVTIEFCDRTELLLTFPPPILGAVTLIPRNSEETAGRFRVWLSVDSNPPHLLWDRKLEGGFPELKVLVRLFGIAR
ncbi:hypothetical protein DXG03_003453 [Asterophora parasitica]|uniref:Uncharacterized protein n=1 Tax=Asterophora parasitica TaxID=117018 RepID=A0A9P7GAD6_9AGAR|nr:hypothetical protein DXG03_003453 [Asterophora parasitica]